MSIPEDKTRAERAARLRGSVAALVERSSYRQAAVVIKISVGALENFIKEKGVPQEKNLKKLEEWAAREGIDLSEGTAIHDSMRIREETPEDAVAVDWPDVSRLKPEAYDFYLKAVGEWTTKLGWTLETAAAAAHDFTAFLRADSTLSSSGPGKVDLPESEQLVALSSLKPLIEKHYGRGGAGGRR